MRRASRRRPTRRTPAPPTRINITLTNTTRATPPNRVLFRQPLLAAALPQSARLALPLEKHENVALANRPLHVAHDRAGGVVEELNADLGDLTGLARTAEHLGDLGELDWLILWG